MFQVFHLFHSPGGTEHYDININASISMSINYQGDRIKIPPSFCIRQCGEDIFTTMLTAGGNKWGIVCKKIAQSLSKSCICH